MNSFMAAESKSMEAMEEGLRSTEFKIQELTNSHHKLQHTVEEMGNGFKIMQSKMELLRSEMQRFIKTMKMNCSKFEPAMKQGCSKFKPTHDLKVLICGYNQEEDCWCELLEEIEDPITPTDEAKHVQERFSNCKHSNHLNMDVDQLKLDKTNSLHQRGLFSRPHIMNKEFCAKENRICDEDRVFDESLERELGYELQPNAKRIVEIQPGREKGLYSNCDEIYKFGHGFQNGQIFINRGKDELEEEITDSGAVNDVQEKFQEEQESDITITVQGLNACLLTVKRKTTWKRISWADCKVDRRAEFSVVLNWSYGQVFQWLAVRAAKILVFDPGGMHFRGLRPPNWFSSIFEDKYFLRRVECYEMGYLAYACYSQAAVLSHELVNKSLSLVC